MSDGTIKIELDIDDKSAVPKAEKSADSLGSSIGSKITSGCKIAGTSLLALGAAGTAAFGKLALDSFKAVGELEQNIGGSEAVFGEYADYIQKKGAEAYNQLGLSQSDYLASANKMSSLFQGSGVSQAVAVDLTTASMQRAADVASVMGISTESAMEAINGAAKGNFTMMDNLGVAINDTSLSAFASAEGSKAQLEALRDQGVISAESYELMAGALGKSTDEMSQAEKNALAMGVFLDKSAYAAGNYAKENETLAGSMASMKAAFENFLSGAGTPEQLAEAFTNFANVVIEMASTLLPNLITALTSLATQIIPQLSGMIGQLAPILVEGVLALIGSIAEVLPALAEALIPAVAQMAEGLISALPLLMEAGILVIVAIIEGISSALPTLIPTLATAAVQMVGVLVENLPLLIEAGLTLMLGLLEGLIAAIPAIIEALPQLITQIVGFLVGALPQLIQGFIQLFMAFVDALPTIITTIVAALPQIITAIINALIIAIPQLIVGFVQLFMAFIAALPQIISAIVAALPQIIDGIVTALVENGPQLQNAAVELFNMFIDGIGSMFGDIVSKVGEIPGKILDALGNVGQLLWDAGSSIIDGLLGGLKAAWDGVTGWFADITSAIPNLKGPAPVDAKLLINNGKLIMQGLGRGLDDGWSGIEQQLKGYTSSIPVTFDTSGTARALTQGMTQRFDAYKIKQTVALDSDSSKALGNVSGIISNRLDDMKQLASRPVVLNVNGRELAYTTQEDYDTVLGKRQSIEIRGFARA